MAFEQKPGFGSIFNNKNKKEDKHPDRTGTICTPDGKHWDVSGWIKKDKGGAQYLSLAIKEPFKKGESQPAKAEPEMKGGKDPMNDAIPFLPCM